MPGFYQPSGFLRWTPTGASDDQTMYFDVCTEEGQDLSSTPTEHPVERGANVTDHVKQELNKVSLEVVISSAPIADKNFHGAAWQGTTLAIPPKPPAPFFPTPGGLVSAIGTAVSSLLGGSGGTDATVTTLKFDSTDFVGDAQAQLETLRDTAQILEVVLEHRLHENMVLTKIQPSRNAALGTSCAFSLEFTEMRFVDVAIVTAPKPAEVRAKKKVNKGTQNGNGLPPAKVSVLQALVDKAKGVHRRDVTSFTVN